MYYDLGVQMTNIILQSNGKPKRCRWRASGVSHCRRDFLIRGKWDWQDPFHPFLLAQEGIKQKAQFTEPGMSTVGDILLSNLLGTLSACLHDLGWIPAKPLSA